jgi:hypothetical protein
VNTAVAGWWARVDKYNSKNWLTRLLAQNWNAIGDSVPGMALRPPGAGGPLGTSPIQEAVSSLHASSGTPESPPPGILSVLSNADSVALEVRLHICPMSAFVRMPSLKRLEQMPNKKLDKCE